jgi:hypothetical protein
MRKSVLALVTIFLFVTPVTVPAATLMVSPFAPEGASVSLDYTRSQVRYRVPSDRFYISRSIESFSWGYESFFATLGYIAATDFDDFAGGEIGDEAGWAFGVGARGAAWRAGDFSALLNAQAHVLNERVVFDGTGRTMQSFEILAGADGVWSRGPLALYAGFETVPYSDLTVKFAGLRQIERSDFITLRAGGRVAFGPWSLNAEVPFVGAEGVRVGLQFAF